MTYLVHWGRDNDRVVTTAEELDTVLDDVSRWRGDGDAPYMVDVVDNDGDPDLAPGLQLGIGHHQRGFVFYTGLSMSESGYAVDESIEPWPDEIGFDHGGQWTGYGPNKTRLEPAAVRRLARDYVRTGQRPGGVRWLNPIEANA